MSEHEQLLIELRALRAAVDELLNEARAQSKKIDRLAPDCAPLITTAPAG